MLVLSVETKLSGTSVMFTCLVGILLIALIAVKPTLIQNCL